MKRVKDLYVMDRERFFNLVRKSPKESLENMSKRTHYYMNFFDKKGRRFNWVAGIFSVLWLFYRQMFLLTFAIQLASFCMGMVMLAFFRNKPSYLIAMNAYNILSGIVLFLVLGFFLNAMYYRHLDTLKKDIQNYGTSKGPLILMIMVSIFVVLVNFIIAGKTWNINDGLYSQKYTQIFSSIMGILIMAGTLLYGLYRHKQENRLSVKDYYLYVLFNVKP